MISLMVKRQMAAAIVENEGTDARLQVACFGGRCVVEFVYGPVGARSVATLASTRRPEMSRYFSDVGAALAAARAVMWMADPLSGPCEIVVIM